jgi:hypothetical protein
MSIGKCVVAGAVAVLVTTAGAKEQAGAQQPTAGQKASAACKDDVTKLCQDVQPGQGRVLECLKSHQAEVSPGCAGFVKQVQQGLKQLSNACEPDVEQFCWDTPIGKRGIAGCLKQHAADLSAPCKSQIAKAKTAKAAPAPK